MLALAIEFTGAEPRTVEPPPRVDRSAQDRRSRAGRFGGHSGGETPGPIPNPEVKPSRADGTALETGWESRSPPEHLREEPPSGGSSLFRTRGAPGRRARRARGYPGVMAKPLRPRPGRPSGASARR